MPPFNLMILLEDAVEGLYFIVAHGLLLLFMIQYTGCILTGFDLSWHMR